MHFIVAISVLIAIVIRTCIALSPRRPRSGHGRRASADKGQHPGRRAKRKVSGARGAGLRLSRPPLVAQQPRWRRPRRQKIRAKLTSTSAISWRRPECRVQIEIYDVDARSTGDGAGRGWARARVRVVRTNLEFIIHSSFLQVSLLIL